jgi:outer membrane protein OmpA-like peptidoglycan-associated protein
MTASLFSALHLNIYILGCTLAILGCLPGEPETPDSAVKGYQINPLKNVERQLMLPVSDGIPPFLKRSFLFPVNSVDLDPTSAALLQRSASWLKAHGNARVLIVGFCDSTGSETCDSDFGERARTIRSLLVRRGVDPAQITGIKGWTAEKSCRKDQARCQQLNRSVWLYVAGATAERTPETVR